MGGAQWYCLFRGDAGPMAVPVETVAEILEIDTLVPLPWSPPHVVGLCPYHREVVPVVSLVQPRSDAGSTFSNDRAPLSGNEASTEEPAIDDRNRCVVLILRTSEGTWGIRADAESTSVSQERPESQAPSMDGNGPVVIGNIRRDGISYGILDAEATWRGLRSAVGRFYSVTSGTRPASPLPLGAEPR
jgi:chemotaxis signal transduction protein